LNTLRSRELQPFPADSSLAAERDSDNQLRQQVSERIAAHRARRDRSAATAPEPQRPQSDRASRIAAAVAERYANSQSYRDFLAAEAQRAHDEAQRAIEEARLAEEAARKAAEASLAQQQLIADLHDWCAPVEVPEEPVAQLSLVPAPGTQPGLTLGPILVAEPAPQRSEEAPATSHLFARHEPLSIAEEPRVTAPTVRSRRHSAPQPDVPLTVRHYQDLAPTASAARKPHTAATGPNDLLDEDENFTLDEEIAFRQTPVFEEPAGPTVPLPANLIEFPRQLIAARKTRPRSVEGPLRDDPHTDAAQLRIFEVESEQLSSTPSLEAPEPEWSSICLEASRRAPIEESEATYQLSPNAAPLHLRLMAVAVDACLLAVSFFVFVAIAALTARQLPTGVPAALSAAGTLLLLFVLYRTLFFTFSDATPGMRYARLALCTLSDENPTRSAMRRRTWALLLSACPLGMGFLWALLDDDRLGWHDRISRMYQRSY
jgi:uncharacterized RDD family membrane protein YckC